MKITTYSAVRDLAAELADRTRDKLPPSEATMLLTFLAAELPDVWNREAWPELCDNLESVAIDANKCFDKREGDADEMGDILAVMDADPRTTTIVQHVTEYTELDDRVNVITELASVYVDWQLPAPDLLEVEADELDDYELPARFKLPLAWLAAAHLLETEDPGRANKYRSLSENHLAKQAARIAPRPWWRKGQFKR